MKIRAACVLFLAFLLAAGVAVAAANADHANNSHVVPLLVHVDKTGKVTDVNPAYDLSPATVKTLTAIVSKMITKPATKDGKPIASQLVMNLALVPVTQSNGARGMSVKYLSSKPLPKGNWFWTHTADHRLALNNQAAGGQIMPFSGGNDPGQGVADMMQRQLGGGGGPSMPPGH